MHSILITGAKGFIGKNLVATLRQTRPELELLEYDVENTAEELDADLQVADFVVHLAGINRPEKTEDFAAGNSFWTGKLVRRIEDSGRRIPVLLSSSTQAALQNPYGVSKREAEDEVFAYAQRTGVPCCVYRFPNVFGKWCRPNYNSAVATFCHNIARDLDVTVNDPSVGMTLVHIDDVVEEIVAAVDGRPHRNGAFCEVPTVHRAALGEIVDRIRSFRASREQRAVPDLSDDFTRKLYATYLSYLPTDAFSYPLKMNVDARGSFTEFLRTPDRGQVSVNVAKPGIVKGNHWHHTKNEKFLVVSGKGVVRFRLVGGTEVVEYPVSGERLEVVDIPTGYTHNIENVGDTDLVTLMWASEAFDPEHPDTFAMEV